MGNRDIIPAPRRRRRSEGVWFQGAPARPDPKPPACDKGEIVAAIGIVITGLKLLASALEPRK